MDKARKPTLLVDTREQRPLYFGEGVPQRRATLPTGDYSVEGCEGLIAIERKSLGDLFGTVGQGRERFEREIRPRFPFALLRDYGRGDIRPSVSGRAPLPDESSRGRREPALLGASLSVCSRSLCGLAAKRGGAHAKVALQDG